MRKLLPTHYFLLTITLPQGLRDVVRSHQKQSYGALFSCTNEALKKTRLLDKIDPAVWKRQWVIDSQAVGQGQNPTSQRVYENQALWISQPQQCVAH